MRESGAVGGYSGLKDSFYYGQRPASVYIPRFRNVGNNDQDYLRGFTFENYTSRSDWTRGFHQPGIGADWKESLTKPGDWSAYFEAYGETLPEFDNQVTLSPDQTDKWGLPQLEISMEYGENARKMRKDMQATAVEMLEACDLDWVSPFDYDSPPGHVIHEMGTARMGNDPKDSFLNKWNQSHEIPNLFVTDGSFMVSSPPQNPSLTYMAMTARAADYAVRRTEGRGVVVGCGTCGMRDLRDAGCGMRDAGCEKGNPGIRNPKSWLSAQKSVSTLDKDMKRTVLVAKVWSNHSR